MVTVSFFLREREREIMAEYLNATPHDIHVAGITFPASKTILRLTNAPNPVIGTFEIAPDTVVDVVGEPKYIGLEPDTLPDPLPRVIIVSSLVGEYLSMHPEIFPGTEIVSPDTSPGFVIRDKDGRIAGTKRLIGYRLNKAV